jgi:hypothetical protein
MIQEGYINANDDSLRGIVVNEFNPDIKIEGSVYYAPDYKAPSVIHGAVGLNSIGLRTVVDGMFVVGKPIPGHANIFIQRGSGQNCSGEVVQGCARGTFSGKLPPLP